MERETLKGLTQNNIKDMLLAFTTITFYMLTVHLVNFLDPT